jgi:hypothetical protein
VYSSAVETLRMSIKSPAAGLGVLEVPGRFGVAADRQRLEAYLVPTDVLAVRDDHEVAAEIVAQRRRLGDGGVLREDGVSALVHYARGRR